MKKKMRKAICKVCGKEFEFETSRKYHPVCCSRKCAGKAKWMNRDRSACMSALPNKDRPLTRETAYLVRLWHENGDSAKKIATALNRNLETIEAILRGEIE